MKIEFPDYNPLPIRKKNLVGKQKEIANLLKKKEKERNNSSNKKFTGWEYKDRYSYRKKN